MPASTTSRSSLFAFSLPIIVYATTCTPSDDANDIVVNSGGFDRFAFGVLDAAHDAGDADGASLGAGQLHRIGILANPDTTVRRGTALEGKVIHVPDVLADNQPFDLRSTDRARHVFGGEADILPARVNVRL